MLAAIWLYRGPSTRHVTAGRIAIRDLESLSDYQDCVRLQQEIWEFPEREAEIVPASLLVVLQRYGGTCIGAFDASEMVGFVVGFVGVGEGRLLHHSHMLAVRSGYRGRGVGAELKWAQRERVQRQGIDLVNWTFDPLQAENAHLNIHRLGAVARKYVEDLYGASESPLHGGLPTDRFEAEWWIESTRVVESKQGSRPERKGWQTLPRVNQTRDLGNGFRGLEDDGRLDLGDEELLVEIPANWNQIMMQERGLAIDWRMKTRVVFQNYFPRYRVEGFLRGDDRCYYRLARSLQTVSTSPPPRAASRGSPR